MVLQAAERQRQYEASVVDVDPASLSEGDLMPDNKTIKCQAGDFCYALWQIADPMSNTKDIMLKQGMYKIIFIIYLYTLFICLIYLYFDLYALAALQLVNFHRLFIVSKKSFLPPQMRPKTQSHLSDTIQYIKVST